MNTWWSARQHAGAEQPIDVPTFDSIDNTFRESATRASTARAEVDEAASHVRLVASPPVRAAAQEVQGRAALLARRALEVFGSTERDGLGPRDVQPWHDASRALKEAEHNLTEAISAELELDR